MDSVISIDVQTRRTLRHTASVAAALSREVHDARAGESIEYRACDIWKHVPQRQFCYDLIIYINGQLNFVHVVLHSDEGALHSFL